jgi:hypothetical protein
MITYAFLQKLVKPVHFIKALHTPWCHLFLIYDE